MSPPPVTPSPHRFVSTAKDPKPPLSTHVQQHQTSHPRTSQHQFASTPRFSFSSLKKQIPAGDASQFSSSPSTPRRLLQQPTFLKQKGEDIEEASSDREIQEASLASDHAIHNAPETTQNTTTNALNASPSLPTLKRRRLIPPPPHEPISISSSPTPTSSPPSTPPPPTTPPPPPPPTHPRFIPAHPSSSPSLPTRPHFLLPPSPPPPRPLPPAFSPPHRRGAKHLPGGLAATLLEWVLEASHNNNHARGRSGGGTWDYSVVVQECRWGERMLLVRERGEGGRGWVFAAGGRGGAVGGAEERVRRGCVVGVRRPVWEVEVAGEGWAVGVEWRVLGEG